MLSPPAGPYVGRFAPSPTGPLHLGSLLSAVGSYLDARSRAGRWLVRIEDLDTPRIMPGCADAILRTLESFALFWDGDIEYQSRRTALYEHALEALRSRRRTFECSCSRRERTGAEDTRYPGTCRAGSRTGGPTATRFRVDETRSVTFEDGIQGLCCFALKSLGDVVIRRRDGVYAYQLAVVVDDAAQDVTDVVRGADLLPSTAWQIELQDALGLQHPAYAHLPLVIEPDGSKLAKSKRSVPVDPLRAGPLLFRTLRLLRQEPPPELAEQAPAVILEWAQVNWRPGALNGIQSVSAPT